MSAYRHLAPAEREHINSVRTGAQQCLSMEPTAPVRRRRNTTTGSKACRRKGDPMRDNFPVGHDLSKRPAGAHWWPGKPIPLLAWLAAVCSGRNLMKSILIEMLHLD